MFLRRNEGIHFANWLAMTYAAWMIIFVATGFLSAQDVQLDGREGRNLALGNFRPRPTLKVEQTLLQQARFPVVDVHTHFRYRLKYDLGKLDDMYS